MKRKRINLSFLDYFIIASLLFFAIGLFSRYTLRERHLANSGELDARVSFEIHAASEETSLSLTSDCELFTTHGEGFGTLLLSSVRVVPAKIRKTRQNGELFELESKTLYDIYGEVLCRGAKTEGGFFLSGVTYLAPNMHFSVKSAKGNFEIYITNIEIF